MKRSERVNAREREQYLREYSILKSQGKPFFPYAVAKDGSMAVIVLVVIILMAILFGAELGPKADPTTTTYTPRPEWYFFFLFELLRVVKPPALVFMATMGIPTICLVLLLVLPFYRPRPGAPPAAAPDRHDAPASRRSPRWTYLTVLGALAGAPTQIDLKVAPSLEKGKEVVASSGLPGLPQDRRERQHAGPEPHEDRRPLGKDAIARTLVNPTPPMPSYAQMQKDKPEQFNELVQFVSSLEVKGLTRG